MTKVRLRELPGWPPLPGGTHERGAQFPISGEAVVSEIFPLNETTITFRGEYGEYPHSYDFTAESEQIAHQIHKIVGENIGKKVAELGEFEIEV